MKNLLFITSFIVLTSCSCAKTATPVIPMPPAQEEKAPAKTDSLQGKINSCTCIKMWMPVCGENKKTYGNSCEADCAGVKHTPGECQAAK